VAEAKTQSYKILVAEDDPSVRLVVEILLRRMGHTVVTARDGKEAIKTFSLTPDSFDILITDHNMPNGTGLELIHYVRKNGFTGRIVAMSGSLTEDMESAFRAKRVDKILQKPFSPEMFSSTLRDFFVQWGDAVSL
jgi:CheY-like chemotaxis protein